jgi:peroxiredoxin
MMRPYRWLLWLVMACLPAASAHARQPEDFTVESPTHGTTFTRSEAKGQVVVLHFLLKTECPFCLRHVRRYATEAARRQDVVHVFLKPDTAEEIKRWAAGLDPKNAQRVPDIYRDADAQLAKAFGIPDGYKFHGESVHYPATVVLDENGRELFRHVGKDNSDRLSYQDFEKRLAAARAGSSDLIPRRGLGVAHAAEVQRELELSDGQVAELERFFARVDGDWFRSRILPVSEQAAVLERLEQGLWEWASTALEPEQLVRLREIEFQAVGSRILLRGDVAKQLKLTATQTDKLVGAARATQAAFDELQAAQRKRQPSDDVERRYREASEAERQAVGQLLTSRQKSQLSALVGEPFDTTQLKRIYPMAPEFATETEWFNSKPQTLANLRGKVVIVHFYAFECHNCHANFEVYKRWHRQWRDKGVVVIGIQSPETSRERSPEAVRQAAAEKGLDFPIIMDTDMKNWNAWANTMWPSVYVVDKHGYLRHWWQGELNWQGATGDQAIERVVESALAESDTL